MPTIRSIYNAGSDRFVCGTNDNDVNQSKFPHKLGVEYNSRVISLARPGCCNFAISLMVKYFIDNIDEHGLYIISTARSPGVSWLKSQSDKFGKGAEFRYQGNVRIEDLNYEDYKLDLLTPLPFESTNILQSETIDNLLLYKAGNIKLNKALSNEAQEKIDAITTYIKEVQNSQIKQQEDISLVATQLFRLNQLTPNWLLLTSYSELQEMFPKNNLELDIGKIEQESPGVTGQRIFTRKIVDWIAKHDRR